MANEPTFNPNAFRDFAGSRAAEPRRAGSVRAGLDVQDRHRVGGDRREGHVGRRAHRHGPRRHPDRRRARSTSSRGTRLRRAVVHRRHRQIEQRRRHQDRFQGRHRASEPVRRAVRLRPADLARLSRREPRHRLESGEVDRQRARVGVDGLSGRRDAAADGGGGQLRGQWRRADRAARRPRHLPRQPPLRGHAESPASHDQRGHRERADDDHGARRRGRHREARADSRVHDRRKDRHGHQARRRPLLGIREQRVVRRVHARRGDPRSAIIVVIDSPHANGDSGGPCRGADLQADRRSGAALSRAFRRTSIPRRRCSSRAATTHRDVAGGRSGAARADRQLRRRRPAGNGAGSARA